MAVLTWLGVPGSDDSWHALGFAVERGTFRVGAIELETAAHALAWGFDEARGAERLAVATRVAPPPPGPQPAHPNLIDRLDHVVYAVPDLDDAVAAIGDVLALEPRRRGTPRPGGPAMAFFRAGDAVLEVVAAGTRSALWGVAFRSPDLDATVTAARTAGGPMGDPKPSIQGGRIATVPTAYVGLRIAVMEPAPRTG